MPVFGIRLSMPVEVASSEGVLDGVEGEVCVAHLLRHRAHGLDLVARSPHLAAERGRGIVSVLHVHVIIILSYCRLRFSHNLMWFLHVLLFEVDPVEEELLDGGVAHVDVAGEDVEVGEYLLVVLSFWKFHSIESSIFAIKFKGFQIPGDRGRGWDPLRRRRQWWPWRPARSPACRPRKTASPPTSPPSSREELACSYTDTYVQLGFF